MGKRGLYTKVKEGSDRADLIKKISDLLEEGSLLDGNKWAEVKTAAACLKRLWTLESEKYHSTKK